MENVVCEMVAILSWPRCVQHIETTGLSVICGRPNLTSYMLSPIFDSNVINVHLEYWFLSHFKKIDLSVEYHMANMM